ncbi:Ubiquitin carboxyl-terminal hydrolase 14 [Phlyctochytrium bullatum]|nr:Ubiquitin carboxyl-terminal hydrolase 14 [Phlyctochytrium bullatum]
MPSVKINVKWSGQKYAVEVDLEQPASVFKSQLFSLTNVEPDRQKILVKGGQLKMMGTAGELPKAPPAPTQFIEDMTDSEVAQAFGEQNNQGFLQQDAEECWGEIISALSDKVTGLDIEGSPVEDKKFVDQYLTGETVSRIQCEENAEEPASLSINTFRQLKVNIGSGDFVRFQWKPTEKIKAKILKEKLSPAKNYLKELEEKKAEEKKKAKMAGLESKMDVDEPVATKKGHLDICKEIGVPESLYQDVGANVSGQYELVAEAGKYDDDEVSRVTEEDITKLEGGGDWHTAYIVLYRAKPLVQ